MNAELVLIIVKVCALIAARKEMSMMMHYYEFEGCYYFILIVPFFVYWSKSFRGVCLGALITTYAMMFIVTSQSKAADVINNQLTEDQRLKLAGNVSHYFGNMTLIDAESTLSALDNDKKVICGILGGIKEFFKQEMGHRTFYASHGGC